MNDTQDIAKAILEDRCIFICGSELSAINGRQPNNKKIVEFFIDYYWKDKFPGRFNKQELLDKSLQEVAQIYFDSVHANDIQFVANQIKNQFLRKYIKKDLDPCATHLLLANLGVREIYTTNYDNLIEKAFTSVGFSEINVINHNNFSELNSKGLPNIYKLCGTIGDSDIILMEKQFSETDPNRLHYPFMRQLLDKIVVFIGYNNRDHVILSAYIDFIKKCQPRRCYCLIPNESERKIDKLNDLNVQYIYREIGEFIFRLRMESLLVTFEYFNYLSERRKLVENWGISALIQELSNESNERKKLKIQNIEQQFNQQRDAYEKTNNTWYYDYKFHYSLYDQLQNQLYAKDFSELYLKLRTFYSTYQTVYAINDHYEIVQYIQNGLYKQVIDSLNKHLDTAICHARFWLTYINQLCNSELVEALQEYNRPLVDYRGNEVSDKIFEKSLNKVLLIGSPNTGKTTFAKRQIVLSLANGNAMPIYIDCKDDNMVSLLNQENFTAFFIKYLDKWQLPSERKEEIIYQRIKSGRILLVVDGFDNLDSERYQDVAERIKSYDEQVQSSMKILITSRVEFVGISQSSRINLTEFSQIKVIKLAMTCNKIFISYSHEDQKSLEELKKYLRPLERENLIGPWDDTRIKPGMKWREEIEKSLSSCKLAILLVSQAFFASEFIAENELPPLLEAAETRGVEILILILDPCNTSFDRSALKHYQTANPPSQPLSSLNPDQKGQILDKLSRRIIEIVES